MKRFYSVKEALDYVLAHPEDSETFNFLMNNVPGFTNAYNQAVAMNDYEAGKIGANDLLGVIGDNPRGGTLNPEQEKWLDNEIARENTQQQQNFELTSRDTSLLSAGSQLQQLGLTASGVLQTGGASAGVQGSTADISHHSASQQRQQARINKYNQQMGLAKSLIGAASSMASSGIYGAALGAVKHAGSQIAGAAAHSGLQALSAIKEVRLPPNRNSVDSRLKKDPYYGLMY